MIVFEYFYDKMEVFGPEMDVMAARYVEMEYEEEEEEEEEEEGEEVSLFIIVFQSICFYLPKCPSVMLHPPSPPSCRYVHSLAHSSWPSVSATMPDCRRGRTMRRVWLPSLCPLWDCQREQHSSGMKSDGTVHRMARCIPHIEACCRLPSITPSILTAARRCYWTV